MGGQTRTTRDLSHANRCDFHACHHMVDYFLRGSSREEHHDARRDELTGNSSGISYPKEPLRHGRCTIVNVLRSFTARTGKSIRRRRRHHHQMYDLDAYKRALLSQRFHVGFPVIIKATRQNLRKYGVHYLLFLSHNSNKHYPLFLTPIFSDCLNLADITEKSVISSC